MESVEGNSVAPNAATVNIDSTLNADYYIHNQAVLPMEGSIKNNNANMDTDVSYFDIPHQQSEQMLTESNEMSDSNIQKPEEKLIASDENVNIFTNNTANYTNVEQILENATSHAISEVSSANTEVYINGSEFPPSESETKQDNSSNDNIMHMSASHYVDNQNQHDEIPVTTYSENNEVLMQENVENFLSGDINKPVSEVTETEVSDSQNTVQSESVAKEELAIQGEKHVQEAHVEQQHVEDQNVEEPPTFTADTSTTEPVAELVDTNLQDDVTHQQTVEHQTDELETVLQQTEQQQEPAVPQDQERQVPQEKAHEMTNDTPAEVADEAQPDSSVNAEMTNTIIIEEVSTDADYETIKTEPLVIHPEEQSLVDTQENVEQTEVIIVQNIEGVVMMETEETVPDSQSQTDLIEIIEVEDESTVDASKVLFKNIHYIFVNDCLLFGVEFLMNC